MKNENRNYLQLRRSHRIIFRQLFNTLLLLLILNLFQAAFASNCADDLSEFIANPRNQLSPDQITHEMLHHAQGLSPSHVSYTELSPLSGREILENERLLIEGDFSLERRIDYEGANQLSARVVTLSNGIKAIWKPHFEVWHSNYRAEVLAYELDQLWGFKRVPPTVERFHNTKKGSLQLFVDSVARIRLKPIEVKRQSLFDFLIYNRDRHIQNYLTASDGKVIPIDHGISLGGDLGGYKKTFGDRVTDIETFLETEDGQVIIDNIRQTLNSSVFKAEVTKYLGTEDTERLLNRMRFIVSFYSIRKNHSSLKETLTIMASYPTTSTYDLEQIISVVKDSPSPIQAGHEILGTILQSENTNDRVLKAIAEAIHHTGSENQQKKKLYLEVLQTCKSAVDPSEEVESLIELTMQKIANLE